MNPPFGPQPAYTNPPITPQYYTPRQKFIQNITLGKTTLVATTTDTNYVVGQEVRLLIPEANGCYQLNGATAFVIELPAVDEVLLEIDSSINVDPFVSTANPNQPQIIPIGDINSGNINASGRVNVGTFIPGSFRNISPL